MVTVLKHQVDGSFGGGGDDVTCAYMYIVNTCRTHVLYVTVHCT